MIRKELLKELIVSFQDSLPVTLKKRQVQLAYDTSKIITLSGVRRSGKSSILMLAINDLLTKGVLREQLLFLNFDDERLHFTSDEYDLIIQAYQELYPNRKLSEVYVFFDEIQMSDGWEQFVRRIYDQHTQHIFITGSNSKMLSSEIATSLRGRTLQYEIFPLSFLEFCDFRNLDVNVYNTSSRSKLIVAFTDFLHYGGFPEIVNANHLYFEKILQEYYFVMLYKDLVERYEIRNTTAIKYFILRMMRNITKPTSINKIYHEMKSMGVVVGKNTLYELVDYLEAIYFFMPVSKYDSSLIRQTNSEKKYYCVDNGFRKALSQNISQDNGLLLENAVYLWLRAKCDMNQKLYYYKASKECDFVLTRGDKVEKLIQVSWDITEASTLKREIDGLIEASKQLNCSNLHIITNDREEELLVDGKNIYVRPAWKIMLSNTIQ